MPEGFVLVVIARLLSWAGAKIRSRGSERPPRALDGVCPGRVVEVGVSVTVVDLLPSDPWTLSQSAGL